MATRTWSAVADGNWSLAANWDGGLSVPATTDAIVFSNASVKNCTIDNLGSWSGGTFTIQGTYSGTITQNTGINITTAAFAQSGGVFTGHSAATFTSTTYSLQQGTFNQGGAFTCTTFFVFSSVFVNCAFVGSSATMATTAVTFSGAGFGGSTTLTATSGIWTLAGNWAQSTTNTTFNANGGTIDITAACSFTDTRSSFNKFTVTAGANTVTINSGTTFPFGASPSTSTVGGTLNNIGIATWTGTWSHAGSLIWNNGSTNSGGAGAASVSITEGDFTISGTASVPISFTAITMTLTSATGRTFAGNSGSYGSAVFKRTGSGSGILTISGSNTFGTFQDNDGTVANTLRFTAGTAQSIGTPIVSGVSGKLVTIDSTSAGTAATLTTTGGINISSDYLSIKDSTVDASPKWYAGANSTNVSGNTNWIFTAPVTSNSFGGNFSLAQGGLRLGRFAPAQGL